MTGWTRVEVRLGALKSNLKLLRSKVPGSRVLAAVKANAYGHGLTTVAAALEDADALAVARLSEAETLRHAGVTTDIVLMAGVMSNAELEHAAALECGLIVHSEYQVELLEAASIRQRRVWLKIDSGMRRLGVEPEAAPALLSRLRRTASAGPIGLMTHLANANDTDNPTTVAQLNRFARVADVFGGDVSVANSAALVGWTSQMANTGRTGARGDVWIRPGISLYGIAPDEAHTAADFGLQPVMTFESVLIAVKPLALGEPVGYGGSWSTTRNTVIGIVAAGYGDGYEVYKDIDFVEWVNGEKWDNPREQAINLAASVVSEAA